MAPTPAHRKSRATIQEVPIAPHGPIWTWQGGWAGAQRRSQPNRCKDGLVDPMPSGGSSYRTPIFLCWRWQPQANMDGTGDMFPCNI